MKKIFILNDIGDELEEDIKNRFGYEYKYKDENGMPDCQYFHVEDKYAKQVVEYIRCHYKNARIIVE